METDDLIIVQGPDGREFEFPAGTDAATIKGAMGKFYQRQENIQSPVAQEPESSGQPQEEGTPWYRNIQNYKDPATLTGALAGAAIGAPLGPLGMAGGSTLGAGIGRSLWGAAAQEDVPTQVRESVKEMAWDAGFSAMFPAFAGFGRWVAGLRGQSSKEIVEAAERLGIDPSLMAVTENRAIKKGWPTVIGVFPFTSGGMEKNIRTGQKSVQDRLNEFLDEVAPTSTLSQLGLDLTQAARSNFNQRLRHNSKILYDNFFDLAKKMGDPPVIPTAPIKEAVEAAQSLRKSPQMFSQEGEVLGKVPSTTDGAISDWISNLSKLGENISPLEWRTLQADLNNLSKKAAAEGIEDARIAMIKSALEDAMAGIAEPELKRAIDVANKYYSQNMQKFSSRTAKHFERVDRNIFKKKGRPQAGSLTDDQIGEVLLRQRTPKAVKELRQIVGSDKVKDLARAAIDQEVLKSYRSAGDSSRDQVFSFAALGKNLKIDNPKSKEYLSELLKGTGVKVSELEDLIRVGTAYESIPLRDPSTFVARRVTLAGFSSLMFLDPAMFITAGPLIAAANFGGRILSNPTTLKLLKTSMDTSKSAETRRVALGKIVQILESDGFEEEGDPRDQLTN